MSLPSSLINRIHYYATHQSGHDAIACSQYTLNYRQLLEKVESISTVLKQKHVSPDSIVGIQCSDDIEHLLLSLALINLGATSVTLPTFESKQVHERIVHNCQVTHLVNSTSEVTRVPSEILAKSTHTNTPCNERGGGALILFSTSGTTGKPKFVMHTDRDIVAQAHRHIGSMNERFTCLASTEHNFAKRHRLYCVAAGATNIFVENRSETLVSECKTLNINVMHVSGFQAQQLLAIDNIHELSNIRLKLGGSHVSDSLRKSLRTRITKTIQAGYGTTETGAIGFTDPNDVKDSKSVGRPLPGIEVKIIEPLPESKNPRQQDLSLTALKQGQHGEIVIRCEGMFRGYLQQPELTSNRLQNGWFYTGDMGFLDEKGRIHLCGRADDMFVFNSINIYPQDLEARLCQHPNVEDVAVLPQPSDVHGSIPVALVKLACKSAQNLADLKKFSTKNLGVRSPRHFHCVEKIPRNSSGKIIRQAAIRLSSAGTDLKSDIVETLIHSPAVNTIKSSLLNQFRHGKKDIFFRDHTIDSITRMELLIMLETQYGIILSPQQFNQISSFNQLIEVVITKLSKQARNEEDQAKLKNQHKIRNQCNAPYVVRLVQRAINFCSTVAELEKLLFLLEGKITAREADILVRFQQQELILDIQNPTKFHQRMTIWCQKIKNMLYTGHQTTPEPFQRCRISSAVTLYKGPGDSKSKTLIICFAIKGEASLMTPNAVLMQHFNAHEYDLLVISEPRNAGYLKGVPFLGKNMIEVSKWLSEQSFIHQYALVRTMGCSAGAFAALVAGYYLNAQLAVCISGRFHSERQFIAIAKKLLTTRKAAKQNSAIPVLMSYAKDNNRDRRYAKTMGKIANAEYLPISAPGKKLGHTAFAEVPRRGKLKQYLDMTVLRSTDNKQIVEEFILED